MTFLLSKLVALLLFFVWLKEVRTSVTNRPTFPSVPFYKGALCKSAPRSCVNNGNCTQHKGYFFCDCPAGYFGYRCEYSSTIKKSAFNLSGELHFTTKKEDAFYDLITEAGLRYPRELGTRMVDYVLYMPSVLKIYGSVGGEVSTSQTTVSIIFKVSLHEKLNVPNNKEINKILFLSYKGHRLFGTMELQRIKFYGLNGDVCKIENNPSCFDRNAECKQERSGRNCRCKNGYELALRNNTCIPDACTRDPCDTGKCSVIGALALCECLTDNFGHQCQYRKSAHIANSPYVQVRMTFRTNATDGKFGTHSSLNNRKETALLNMLVTSLFYYTITQYVYTPMRNQKSYTFYGCNAYMRKETGKVTVDYNLYMSTRRYMQSLRSNHLWYQFHKLNYTKDEMFNNIKDVNFVIYGHVGRVCNTSVGCNDDNSECDMTSSICVCKNGYQRSYHNSYICVSDPCNTQPCGPGRCLSDRGWYSCDCPTHFSGTHCANSTHLPANTTQYEVELYLYNTKSNFPFSHQSTLNVSEQERIIRIIVQFVAIHSYYSKHFTMHGYEITRLQYRNNGVNINLNISSWEKAKDYINNWMSYFRYYMRYSSARSTIFFKDVSYKSHLIYGITGEVCRQTSGCLDDYAACNSTGQCGCKYGHLPHRSHQCAKHYCSTLPCKNGGNCTENGPKQFKCICKLGYTGALCQNDICETTPLPCKRGLCSHVNGVVKCECLGHYKGEDCGIEIKRKLCDSDSDCNERNTKCILDGVDDTDKCFCKPGFADDLTGCTEITDIGLFPYGDKHSTQVESNFKMKFNGPALFGGDEHEVHISPYGYVTLNRKYDSASPLPLPRIVDGSKKLTMFAPLWTYGDLRGPDSKIYQKTYTKTDKFSNTYVWRIMSRIDQAVRKLNPSSKFITTWALIVTWFKVRPYPYYRYSSNEANTYQMVLATSDTDDFGYTMFLYGDMTWSTSNRRANWIGISCPGFLYNSHHAANASAFEMNKQEGTKGIKGEWIFGFPNVISNDTIHKRNCLTWARNHGAWTNVWRLSRYIDKLPTCPCQMKQALEDGKFMVSDYNNLCVITWGQGEYFRECCYDTQGNATDPLIQTAEDGSAGSVILYNPSYQFNLYLEHDRKPKQDCCIKSDLCATYYTLRPPSTCDGYRPPWIAWFLGDPHITTLDQLEYTFNGLGEYWLVKSNTITIQARTAQALNSEGKLVKATVFSAIAAREKNTNLHVQMTDDRSHLLILVGNENFTAWFYNSSAKMKITPTLILKKLNRTLVTSFPSGVSLKITLSSGKIDVIFSLPVSLQNSTSGLLGNFNNNPDDDLIAPNGTVVHRNSTQKHIYYHFGELWRINTSESIFKYGTGESPLTFMGRNFTPLFEVPITDKTTSERANQLCTEAGKLDENCLYDFLSTDNEALAKETMDGQKTNHETVQIIAQLPPEISGPVAINGTVGKEFRTIIRGSDGNGDNITIHLRESPEGSQLQNISATSAVFTWTPISLQPRRLRLFSKDSTGQISPDLNIRIQICSCSEHGDCQFSEPLNVQPEGATNFIIVSCNCDIGWRGDHCEIDIDGCEGSPCVAGTNCTDLTPAEQANNTDGYICSECPEGYTSEDEGRCFDKDECQEGTNVTDCKHQCVNTPGSYHCKCNSGYRLINHSTCEDIDECTAGTSNCAHKCTNTQGGYKCTCFLGYELNKDNKSCDDKLGMCNKTKCQFGCRFREKTTECFCPAGYVLSSDGIHCEDINECTTSHNCDPNSKCNNTDGSYQCLCESGYTIMSDGRQCQPCDDTRWGPSCQNFCSCPAGVKCNKASGCEQCPDGYTGGTCEDVDECENDQSRCGNFSQCMNTEGSYRCKCNDGYISIGDKCEACDVTRWGTNCENLCLCAAGVKCDKVTGCEKCPDGYSGGNCDDVDECSKKGLCGDLSYCVNTLGSFSCFCKEGYFLKGRSCEAIPQTTVTMITNVKTEETTKTVVTGRTAHATSSISTEIHTTTTEDGKVNEEDGKLPLTGIIVGVAAASIIFIITCVLVIKLRQNCGHKTEQPYEVPIQRENLSARVVSDHIYATLDPIPSLAEEQAKILKIGRDIQKY